MGEVGVFSGPAKLSVLCSWHSGMDRRNGTTNTPQGCITDPVNASSTTVNPRFQSSSTSNTGLFRPYSYIMVYGYGLGNSINADTGEGHVQDAFCKAARLDYAVAANLNVFGSFFQANRVGNGYGWGYLRPTPVYFDPVAKFTKSGVSATDLTLNGSVTGLYRGATNPKGTNLANVAPNIPDNDLGWEVDTGFDWKLLEGLTVRSTFGYWQPGKWFNFACIDKANPFWLANAGTAPTTWNGIGWGINPSRDIDPVVVACVQILADF